MTAWGGSGHLRELLGADPEVDLDEEALNRCFDLARVQESSKVVFDRIRALELDRKTVR
jgi:hypothetical protein